MSIFTGKPFEEHNNWRFETKYHIDYPEYYALKNALTPYLKPDSYTICSPQKKYLVRSLYFDTRDYRFYMEKINGVSNRIKFRIRTYGTHPDQNPDIRVEMKVRKGKLMEKYGVYITSQQCQQFITTRNWGFCDDSVLVEFQRYVYRWDLVPKTLVQYFREGYESRDKEKLRITFDHGLKSFSTKFIFPQDIIWRHHFQSQVVLEIKHQNHVPSWLSELIKLFHLKVIPNSKYANSVEISQKDIIPSSMTRS